MAGPFGFAYGIGAGTAGIPDAIIKGREDAQQMALKNMQLEQMRKQMQDEEEARKIMATPFQGAPDTTVTTGGGEMPMAESAPGVAAEAYQQEAGGAPNAAIPQSMEIPTQARTIKAYATPQQKMAAEYRQKAEMLRSKGLWRSAMELEKNAETFDDHHSKAARRGLADAVAFGPGMDKNKALEFIHGMGGTGVVDVSPSTEGGLILTIQDPNGREHDVMLNEKQYAGLISGQDPAAIINQAATQMYRQRGLEQRGSEFSQREDRLRTEGEARAKAAEERNEIARMNAANRAEAMKTPGGSGVVTRVMARKQNLIDMAAAAGQPIDPIAAENQAWEETRPRKGEITVLDRWKSADRVINSPTSSRADKEAAKKLKAELEAQGVVPPSQTTGAPKNATPGKTSTVVNGTTFTVGTATTKPDGWYGGGKVRVQGGKIVEVR